MNLPNMKRTIEPLADSGVITLPPLVEVSNEGPGPSTATEYRVSKRNGGGVALACCPAGVTVRVTVYFLTPYIGR